MKKRPLFLILGVAALFSGCGGGGGGGGSGDSATTGDPPPTVTAAEIPSWALADSASFTRYTNGLNASDNTEPVDLLTATAPSSESDEPVAL
ncbi:MAG: hypothetical protein AB3X44_02895 [Leptothrix sp. (in: b-proteobacteria)]